ncbi:MAG: UDP-N-acetylmuramate dehydrogenase [Chitinophagales bacterium]
MRLEQVISPEIIRYDEPMNLHTTFRIGGPADILVVPRSIEEVKAAIGWARLRNISFFIMGQGSNLLVRDAGIRGLVIKLGESFRKLGGTHNNLTALAGNTMSETSREALLRGLTGLEFAEGIPGSVGGAVYMNAGAYGGEISQVVNRVKVLDRNGNEEVFNRDQMHWGYRKSIFQSTDYLILEAEFELYPGDTESIEAAMKEYSKARSDKQPLEYPSGGSVFRRPEGHFVGPMIEEVGLKGFMVGDAQVSEKHAGFIINRGHATAEDVLKLIEIVRARIRERFGVVLELELLVVGG